MGQVPQQHPHGPEIVVFDVDLHQVGGRRPQRLIDPRPLGVAVIELAAQRQGAVELFSVLLVLGFLVEEVLDDVVIAERHVRGTGGARPVRPPSDKHEIIVGLVERRSLLRSVTRRVGLGQEHVPERLVADDEAGLELVLLLRRIDQADFQISRKRADARRGRSRHVRGLIFGTRLSLAGLSVITS